VAWPARSRVFGAEADDERARRCEKAAARESRSVERLACIVCVGITMLAFPELASFDAERDAIAPVPA